MDYLTEKVLEGIGAFLAKLIMGGLSVIPEAAAVLFFACVLVGMTGNDKAYRWAGYCILVAVLGGALVENF